MYFVFGEPLMLSKHNPVSSLYLSTYKGAYNYEYYISGYPKSVIIKTSISWKLWIIRAVLNMNTDN